MKKLLFILFLGFVFLNHVSAVDVNAQVDELLNNINKTKEKIQISNTTMLEKIYPIGSIFITTECTTPEEVENNIGGTWERYSNGRNLIGVDESISEFNSANKTDGKSEILLAPTNLPSHSHSVPKLSGTAASAGNHTHNVLWNSAPVGISHASGNIRTLNINSFDWGNSHIYSTDNFKTTTATTHFHEITIAASNTKATSNVVKSFSNLQPYITVYIYKRIS